METFEWIVVLMIATAALAVLSRRIGAPYPTLLALGGIVLAFIPESPKWELDPKFALALFVAPVLLDAAYDTSLRDLRAIWKPVTGLVIAAVGTTVAGVAITCHWLIPSMPWSVAITLGAIVAPPDAAAATAVMRMVGLPHRMLNILEGESLLNDASALFIYRLALMSVLTGSLRPVDYLPVFFLSIFGSIASGVLAAKLLRPILSSIQDVPVSLIAQFAATFGIWILAEKIELSGVLTMVAFAMTMARGGGPQIPARMRVPINAVWETAVFVLNAFAFVLIGMQLRPIFERLSLSSVRNEAIVVSFLVLFVVIFARFFWVMGYSALVMYKQKKSAPTMSSKRSWEGAIVVSWAGMRGIVTLAAALAIPRALPNGTEFPHRELIVFCAFIVVLGTLLIQGLTMKSLIRLLNLSDDNPVAIEVRHGRLMMYKALLSAIENDETLHAKLLRKEYQALIQLNENENPIEPLQEVPGGRLRRGAIAKAREVAINLLRQEVIGDQAYRILTQELDWAELHSGGNTTKRVPSR